ncbi:hypothetical protein BZL42_08675 [Pseudomonas indica]|nr:hypothetical protein BZL42_08675 [Pseudomonas indica]
MSWPWEAGPTVCVRGGFQPRSRGLTRRRQACWRSRMRVWEMFMLLTLRSLAVDGKLLLKIGRNHRIERFLAIYFRKFHLCGWSIAAVIQRAFAYSVRA